MQTQIWITTIHGLDTASRDTLTDPRDPENEGKWANWLHPGMLQDTLHRNRIFRATSQLELLQPGPKYGTGVRPFNYGNSILLSEMVERGSKGVNKYD
jgi:hypothetical protein